ncbi:hypothetical protein [Streptomyces sp. NPDC001568]|uniref:hypothetical protein n=1 Tax=Streptomyces sp. NPDC001568 TaxID=3364588 RepID=UPI00367D84A3
MPWTLPLRPSRRRLLVGAAGAAGAALLPGCSGGSDPSDADTGVPLERRIREGAVRDSERLLERYEATTAAHPALAARLAPLRTAVAAHVAALALPGPASPTPSATGKPLSAGASGTPSGSPSARPDPVPPKEVDALAALADAERDLSEARTVSLAGAPGELARLLASVAACGAVHTYLLTATPTPGAAS